MERPVEVDRALVLLWAAFGLACFSTVLSLIGFDDDDVPLRWVAAPAVALLALNAGLIWLIGQRHNWARILFLVLVVIFTPFLLMGLPETVLEWIAKLADVIACAIEILAVFWLFRSDGADWFKRA